MKLAIGVVLGLFYGFLSSQAFLRSSSGWSAGHSDLGFWWGVIGALLGIVGVSLLIGSWIHTRPSTR